MSFEGLVCALVGALSAAAIALMLPFLTIECQASERRGISFPALAAASFLFCFALSRAHDTNLNNSRFITAIVLSSIMLIGVISEWLRDAMIRLRMNWDALLMALLASSVSMLWCARILGHRLTVTNIGLFFVWGIAWQFLANRLLLADEPTRRSDPPDLGALRCHSEFLHRFPRTGGK